MDIVSTLDPSELALKQKMLRDMFGLHIEITCTTITKVLNSFVWGASIYDIKEMREIIKHEGYSESYEGILRYSINACIEYLQKDDTSHKG